MSWLTGWVCRKSHTLIGSTDGAQTDYQIKITAHYGSGSDSGAEVYLNSKSKTDFGDIRFTKSDGVTPLDFWIEKQVNSDYAIIWVEVDTIPASPDTVDIYIYYGKADATTTSNGGTTFLFFDDFNDGTYTDKWTRIADGGSTTESGGTITVESAEVAHERLNTIGTFSYNTSMRTYMKITEDDGGFGYHTDAETANDVDGNLFGIFSAEEYEIAGNGTSADYGYPSGITNVWKIFEISRGTANTKFYINNALDDTLSYPTSTNRYGMLYARKGADVISDWFLIRKYTANEPTHDAWGSAENLLFLSQTISVLSEYSRVTETYRTFAQPISVLTELTRMVTKLVALQQSISVSTTFERLAEYQRVFNQPITILTEFDRIVDYQRVFDQAITVFTEGVIELNLVFTRVLSQSISVLTEFERIADLQRTFDQPISVLTEFEKLAEYQKVFDQPISVLTEYYKTVDYQQVLDQVITVFTEVATEFTIVFRRVLSQSISVLTEFERIADLQRTFDQPVTVLTELIKTVDKVLEFQQTINVLTELAREVDHYREFDQPISVSMTSFFAAEYHVVLEQSISVLTELIRTVEKIIELRQSINVYEAITELDYEPPHDIRRRIGEIIEIIKRAHIKL